MTEPLYNSSAVLAAVCDKHKGKKAKRIAAAVDDFANTQRGHIAASSLLVCGGDSITEDTFKHLASEYVREHVYGSIGGLLIWVLVKPLVMSIIASFIESMIFSYSQRSEA